MLLLLIEKIIKKIFELLKREANKRNMPHPNLICEWGRFMVAPAQINVYKVIDTKEINHKGSKAKKWYVIDGSFMNDLIDTWAIKQKWAVAPINNRHDNKLTRVWIRPLLRIWLQQTHSQRFAGHLFCKVVL